MGSEFDEGIASRSQRLGFSASRGIDCLRFNQEKKRGRVTLHDFGK